MKSDNVLWVTVGFGPTTWRTGTVHGNPTQDDGHPSTDMSRGLTGTEWAV